jgi:hypothetical protein
VEVRPREMAGATEMTEAVSRNAATIQGAHSRRWTEIHFSYQPTFESDYRAVRELYARRWGMGLEFLFMCAAVVVFALIVVFAAVLLGERGWLAVAKEGMSWWLLPGILAAILPTIQAAQVLLRRWSHPSCCEKLTFSINSREISVKGQTIRSCIPWNAVSRVMETREFFHVYSASRLVYSISKKAMGPAACDELRQLVHAFFANRSDFGDAVAA